MLQQKIGVFDSGVGGLTVLQELQKVLPYEDFIYLGDTQRMPYGKKSREEVKKYTEEALIYFKKRGVKGAVIACNTATAASLPSLEENFSFPILGVISPGASSAVESTENNRILLVATKGTVQSKCYDELIRGLNPEIVLESIPCPHLVLAVEDGFGNHYIGGKIAVDYIEKAKNENYDTLILGCTHFPVVREKIEEYFHQEDRKVKIVDPAKAVAKEAALVIPLTRKEKEGTVEYNVTGDRKKFSDVAQKILNEKDRNLRVKKVKIELS